MDHGGSYFVLYCASLQPLHPPEDTDMSIRFLLIARLVSCAKLDIRSDGSEPSVLSFSDEGSAQVANITMDAHGKLTTSSPLVVNGGVNASALSVSGSTCDLATACTEVTVLQQLVCTLRHQTFAACASCDAFFACTDAVPNAEAFFRFDDKSSTWANLGVPLNTGEPTVYQSTAGDVASTADHRTVLSRGTPGALHLTNDAFKFAIRTRNGAWPRTYTLAMWVQFSSTTPPRSYLADARAVSSSPAAAYWFQQGGQMTVCVDRGGTYADEAFANTPSGGWEHYAIVATEGSDVCVYKDGLQVHCAGTPPCHTPSPAIIGTAYDVYSTTGTNDWLNGYIDDVYFSDSALTTAQIAALKGWGPV